MQQSVRESSPQILRVDELVKIYGKRRIVDGVSFHVNRSVIVGLIGTNGGVLIPLLIRE